ncbi:sensor histidine kinase [Ramlibacter rhizophilus]|uniref:histidine kinase n=1 Tax=Ramlibacter rhizophilus TaxID=1781167 RepID=A0A4Z0BKM7_9BURK|nr:HAMP domain-containing sensor histidine kinase [Ramlibacter rhizophilus]TFY98458.1 HAMP domain-containing histidine kinase [Ramlibacter rhizophilus]
MYQFLAANREELIARCKQKVAARPKRSATPQQLVHGIPIFLEQLTRTLEAEEKGQAAEGTRISGAAGGQVLSASEIGVTAAAHGKELLELGFSVDQVVHDYGDLCQAITDLAVERDAPFTIDEFRTLNRCLDNAIADAVTEFSALRDVSRDLAHAAAENRRMGFLVHELRNGLGTASLALNALEMSNMPVSGATGAVLKRSLATLRTLTEQAIAEVRSNMQPLAQTEVFLVADFIAEVAAAARLDPKASHCEFAVDPVDPRLAIAGNRGLLSAAVGNLLQNAFKFTHAGSRVQLRVTTAQDSVVIEVEDRCGGLRPGSIERMFRPFSERLDETTGLGLGLCIAHQSVEADGGVLSVRNLPGVGCVFTMQLPAHSLGRTEEVGPA